MSDDPVLQALAGISERLDRLEARTAAGAALAEEQAATLSWALDGLGNVRERVPVMLDGAMSLANLTLHGAADAGVDPIDAGVWALDVAQRAAQPGPRALVGRALDADTLNLAEKALDPETLALLDSVLDNADLLRFALTAGAALKDALGDRDVAALAQRAGRLAAVLDSPEMDALLDSGVLDGPALRMAADASTALVQAEGSSKPVGAMGAFFALSDPDVKKAVGLGLAIAKNFGAHL